MLKGSAVSNLITRLKENTNANGGLFHVDASNYNIGPNEIMAIGDAIRINATAPDGSPVQTLDFSGNPICGLNSRGKGNYDPDGLLDFCNSINSIVNKSIQVRLKKLFFNNCILQEPGITILGNFVANSPSTLQELHLKNCRADSNSIEKLCEGMKGNKSVIVLDISENKINSGGGMAIAEMLSVNTRLKHLIMNSCDVSVEGGITIFQSLQNNISLEILSITDNDLGDESCESLASLLKVNQKLKYLDISENGIGYEGTIALSKAFIKNRTLTVLGLQWNDLNNDCAKKIGEVLQVNNTLKVINVLGNQIDVEGIQTMVTSSLTSSDRPIDFDVGFSYRPSNRSRVKERKVLKDAEVPLENIDGEESV
jgi:hypothetical protein